MAKEMIVVRYIILFDLFLCSFLYLTGVTGLQEQLPIDIFTWPFMIAIPLTIILLFVIIFSTAKYIVTSIKEKSFRPILSAAFDIILYILGWITLNSYWNLLPLKS